MSFEVKRRILYSTPHMGGKKLKQLVRLHARKGTVDSFIADLESRLDRFIYRLNLVPSIFAARHVIGAKHVLVNGRVCNRSGMLLRPMDVVEPKPSSIPLFKRLIRARLATNTFVLADERKAGAGARGGAGGDAERSAPAAAKYDLDRLRADAPSRPPAGRTLPPPEARGAAAASEADAATSVASPLLEPLVLSLLGALGGQHLASELTRRRGELSVRSLPGRGPVNVALQQGAPNEPKLVASVDRMRLRRLLLGLLAVRHDAAA